MTTGDFPHATQTPHTLCWMGKKLTIPNYAKNRPFPPGVFYIDMYIRGCVCGCGWGLQELYTFLFLYQYVYKGISISICI